METPEGMMGLKQPKPMKRILKRLSPVLGKRRFQRFFEAMHAISLAGMNFGVGGNPEKSGEIAAARYVAGKLGGVQGAVIFDVGANVGTYALLLLDNIKCAGLKIFAFEPSTEAFSKLERNVAGRKNISPWNLGLGEEDGLATLFYDSPASTLASVYKRRLDHLNIAVGLNEDVRMRTIDSFCGENGIDRINFLKLDVEGHELSVLKGAKRMMESGAIDFIQFEFGGCNIDSRTYFQDMFYLLKPRYDIYRVLKNGLYPVREYMETHEIFITTNYLAENKHLRRT